MWKSFRRLKDRVRPNLHGEKGWILHQCTCTFVGAGLRVTIYPFHILHIWLPVIFFLLPKFKTGVELRRCRHCKVKHASMSLTFRILKGVLNSGNGDRISAMQQMESILKGKKSMYNKRCINQVHVFFGHTLYI